MTKNLTAGRPGKTILFFAVPMLLGNIFQQLYNMVDSVVVGNFVGFDALAAVGNSFTITFCATALAFGLSSGATIYIGQHFGAGNSRKVRQAVVTSTVFSVGFSLVLSLAGVLLCRPLLALVRTPASVMPMSLVYMRIYLLGLVFTFTYNMLSAVFRALGDSKMPLAFLVVASVVNIVLDLLFVLAFDMGVAGVALATVIAQAVSSVLAFVFFKKQLRQMERQEQQKDGSQLQPTETLARQFQLSVLWEIIRLAVPATLQQIAISGGIIIMQGFVNSFGPQIMAAYTAAIKFENIIMMSITSISIAVTAFAAQNMGARQTERVRSGYRWGLLISLFFALVLGAAAILLREPLISLFISGQGAQAVIEAGSSYLVWTFGSSLFMALLFSAEGVLKGAGDVTFCMVIGFASILVKVAAAYVLSPRMGYQGLWATMVIGWGAEALCATGRYLSGRWKSKGVTAGSWPKDGQLPDGGAQKGAPDEVTGVTEDA
ncbi:MATE family efflux transporter [Neobittarella massiliensis]|uniref:MATE family efflux transporter n=1 Tax=Neobittarella massiliensis (ex Bilen et al. 2018) TaxID=2041842 RepID=UPI000CF6B143|nr:MATE family efflux transporter [Neobittarella massiliensis]